MDFRTIKQLCSDEDSMDSQIHVRLKDLKNRDLDSKKLQSCEFQKSTIKDWLSFRSPVPLIFLKDSISPRRIEGFYLRAGKHKVKLPRLDEKLAYLAGVVFGDGHVKHYIRKKGYRQYSIIIEKKRTQYSEKYLPRLWNEVFGVSPCLTFSKRKSELVRMCINSKVISRMFTEWLGFSYGKKSSVKMLQKVRRWPRKLKKYFIAGLFDTDGGPSWNSYMFGSISHELVLFVGNFLSTNKIATKIYTQRYPTSDYFHLFIIKKDKKKFLRLLPLRNTTKFG